LKWVNMKGRIWFTKGASLISGEGKYHGYNFYKVAGVNIGVKRTGEGENEEPPVDLKSLIH
jgi:NADH-quinone oxidoreductase subunit I